MLNLTMTDGYLFHDKKGRPVQRPIPLAPLADTHTHLTQFDGEVFSAPLALARAQAAGVRFMVVPVDPTDDAQEPLTLMSQLSFWQSQSEKLAQDLKAEGVQFQDFGAGEPAFQLPGDMHILVGVHPYGAEQVGDEVFSKMELLLSDSHAIGVGEIGLDYNCDVDPDVQKRSFREQLALAREKDLPVELHIRDAKGDEAVKAHADAYEILKKDGGSPAGVVLHCFTQGPSVMEPFSDMGCYIAFGGACTFKNTPEIRQAAALCPEHLLLAETDAPYMAPHPLRGQVAESAMVALNAAKLAEVRSQAGVNSPQRTYELLWNNAMRLFGKA